MQRMQAFLADSGFEGVEHYTRGAETQPLLSCQSEWVPPVQSNSEDEYEESRFFFLLSSRLLSFVKEIALVHLSFFKDI